MTDTLLEQTRALHEDIERMERKIVEEFKKEPEGHRDRLLQSHTIRALLDAMQSRSKHLLDAYADATGVRIDDAAALGHPDDDPQETMARFRSRLGTMVREHQANPSFTFSEGGAVDPTSLIPPVNVDFSGEERWGRTFDLLDHHRAFVNGGFVASHSKDALSAPSAPLTSTSSHRPSAIDYVTYLHDHVGDPTTVPRAHKSSPAYTAYLTQLVGYLEGFYRRTQPLVDTAKNYAALENAFREDWTAGEVEGWEDRGLGVSEGTTLPEDLSHFSSVDGMMTELGPERIKAALDAVGLKAGGTEHDRAQRLWRARDVPLSSLPPKLFQKGRAPTLQMSSSQREKRERSAYDIAWLETKVVKLLDVMSAVLEATCHFAEKKQVQTWAELEADREDEADGNMEVQVAVPGAEDDEDDDYMDGGVYNPWKIPLGWDGKPLPVWLYKLHGLNVEFKCEICGNASYWGRRAFEVHFNEAQHVAGLRALGIRMGKEYYEITSIAEARALHETIKARDRGGFTAAMDEEVEDADGTVYTRKTYEDLKRQGII